MARIIITPGASDTPDAFLKEPRPKQVHLVYDNGQSEDVTLKDERKPQTFTLKKAKQVGKIDLVITTVYPSQGGQDTAITEVEFRKKG